MITNNTNTTYSISLLRLAYVESRMHRYDRLSQVSRYHRMQKAQRILGSLCCSVCLNFVTMCTYKIVNHDCSAKLPMITEHTNTREAGCYSLIAQQTTLITGEKRSFCALSVMFTFWGVGGGGEESDKLIQPYVHLLINRHTFAALVCLLIGCRLFRWLTLCKLKQKARLGRVDLTFVSISVFI